MGISNKNQHWVPQFYLRRFAIPETRGTGREQVWAFPKEEGVEFPTNVHNIAAKRFLYTPRNPDGSLDDTLDARLRDLEEDMGAHWSAFANEHYPLDGGFREGLSLFIATLYLRHPRILETCSHVHRRLGDAFDQWGVVEKDALLRIGGTDYRVDWSKWDQFRTASDDDVKRSWNGFILGTAGDLAKHLLLRSWSVVFAEAEVFVTSDHPVAVAHGERRDASPYTEGAPVYFPLSPTRLLVIGDGRYEDGAIYPLRPAAEASFNYFLLRCATRFMFSPWEPTRTLEGIVRLGEEVRRGQVQRGREALGLPRLTGSERNMLCRCGSGRKYKKCCGV